MTLWPRAQTEAQKEKDEAEVQVSCPRPPSWSPLSLGNENGENSCRTGAETWRRPVAFTPVQVCGGWQPGEKTTSWTLVLLHCDLYISLTFVMCFLYTKIKGFGFQKLILAHSCRQNDLSGAAYLWSNFRFALKAKKTTLQTWDIVVTLTTRVVVISTPHKLVAVCKFSCCKNGWFFVNTYFRPVSITCHLLWLKT